MKSEITFDVDWGDTIRSLDCTGFCTLNVMPVDGDGPEVYVRLRPKDAQRLVDELSSWLTKEAHRRDMGMKHPDPDAAYDKAREDKGEAQEAK